MGQKTTVMMLPVGQKVLR